MFRNAIVRIPGSNFADGLTTVSQGIPSFEKVLEQHSRYCEALRECGLSITVLEADPDNLCSRERSSVGSGRIPGAHGRTGEARVPIRWCSI